MLFLLSLVMCGSCPGLLVLVPVAFVPFSYARLRFHTYLERLLGVHTRAASLFFLPAVTKIEQKRQSCVRQP